MKRGALVRRREIISSRASLVVSFPVHKLKITPPPFLRLCLFKPVGTVINVSDIEI